MVVLDHQLLGAVVHALVEHGVCAVALVFYKFLADGAHQLDGVAVFPQLAELVDDALDFIGVVERALCGFLPLMVALQLVQLLRQQPPLFVRFDPL